MNIREYISSGIIESYVLGLASEAERQEFEIMCAAHSEIEEARTTFELALEQNMLSDAAAPPVHLKKIITEKLDASLTSVHGLEPEEKEPAVRRIGSWQWIAAASLILLAGTIFWAVTTNQKYRELKTANNDLERRLEESSAQLDTLLKDAAMLQKPGMRMAAMQGTSNPAMYATVYWDTASKDVYLMINNLPQPASDKQYQLWALLGKQPIDLGMIEVRQQRLLYHMKNVQHAQAFAITLEPKGGSPVPTSSPVVLSRL